MLTTMKKGVGSMDYTAYVRERFGADLTRLKEHLPDFLSREMGISPNRKFHCLSPQHQDRHPSMSYYEAGQCVKCFSCGFTADLLTVAKLHWGLTEDADSIDRLLSLYPDCRVQNFRESQKVGFSPYLQSRGLTADTLKWAGVFETMDGKLGRAVALPYHQGQYMAYRSIEGKVFRKPSGLTEPVCFPEWLDSSEPVFLVEAYICALSVYQCGGKAIPCNGVGYRQVLDALGERRPTFLVAFDHDERGEQAAKRFCEEYAEMGGKARIVDLSGAYKDPNERLMHDPEGLKQAVKQALSGSVDLSPFPTLQQYLSRQFFTDLSARADRSGCLTGWDGIDRQLGGLTPGLYILGGVPSVGKTTFLGQMAVHLAEQGGSVLFLSYEQSPFEFTCKALARMSYRTQQKPFVSRDLVHGFCDDRVRQMAQVYEQKMLDLCVLKVRDTAEQLGERIRQFAADREHPVVVIDYLQFIPGTGSDPRLNNDRALQILSQATAGLEVILILVSSFNRSSYLLPVTFESFKESGNVEYYADGLWGLSYSILSSSVFQKDGQLAEKQAALAHAREQAVRKLDFCCVKARHGGLFTVGLDYYAAHDYFAEATTVKRKRI